MKTLVAATVIAGLTLVGFTALAGTAYADGPIHIGNGMCMQPGSNPPLIVACDSPFATTPMVTTPFVPIPTTEPTPVTTEPASPVATVPLPDGSCYQPGSNPPIHVDCDTTRATTPYKDGERFVDDPPSKSAPDVTWAPPSTTVVVSAAPAITPTVDTSATAAVVEAPARVFVAAPRRLPTTGSSTTIPVIGGVTLLVGAVLIFASRRAAV